MRDIIQVSVALRNYLLTKYLKKAIPNEKMKVKFLDEYSFQVTYAYSREKIQRVKSVKFCYENYFKIEILR